MEGVQGDRNIGFEFNGSAFEYFKIWIVNIALSIVTLGIYSAWAKVRTKRYFYGNTTLDGSSFEYLANPISILKGRLIVFGFILIYAVTTKFLPMLELGFFIVYIIALPWMVIKSMQFNARNSAYRNVRFNFDAKVKEAVFVFILLPLFSILTFGLALPHLIKRIKQFSIEHSHFGKSKFNFHASTWAFYKIYLKAFLVPVLLGIIFAVAIPAYNAYVQRAQQDAMQVEQPVTQEESMQVEQPVMQPEWTTPIDNTPISSEQQSQTTPPDLSPEDIAAIQTATTITFVLIMAFYMLIGVYVQTRTTNLVLSSSSLDQHKLVSTLRVRNMFYIHLTNILAVIASLGLLIPWAKIRLARYRVKNMAMIAQGDLDSFIANEQDGVKATAGEFAEAFDLDLGL